MKPLATNRRVLTWFCVCPFDRNTSVQKKTFFAILSSALFIIGITKLVSSIIFFAKNISIDLEGCLYAVFQVAAYSGLLYSWMIAFILRKKIEHALETLEAICEESRWKETQIFSKNFLNFKLWQKTELKSFIMFQVAVHRTFWSKQMTKVNFCGNVISDSFGLVFQST